MPRLPFLSIPPTLRSRALTTIVVSLALVAGFTGHVHGQCPPRLVGVTAWSHGDYWPTGGPDSLIRGLAYDGTYYYVADIREPGYNYAGAVYVYDANGFVKKIPKAPPVQGTHFPHGVAVDGVSMWVTDYVGRTIYQYNVASGNLIRKFRSPPAVGNPVRLDFDSKTRTLWVTGYANPRVYQVGLDGKVVSSFFAGAVVSKSKLVALAGNNSVWIADTEADPTSLHLLHRYSFTGQLLEAHTFVTGWSVMATNINDRSNGFYQDTTPVFDPGTNTYRGRIEHYVIGATCSEIEAATRVLAGYLDRLAVNVFRASNDYARAGVRSALANKARAAANAMRKCDKRTATNLLNQLLQRVDDEAPPNDWMSASVERDLVRLVVQGLIAALEC